MPSTAEVIEGIFTGHVALIDDIKTTYNFEPGVIDAKQLPMVTMFFLLPEGNDVETGPEQDVDYRWEISLYVALNAWKDAQAKMRDLSQLVVKNFNANRDDYDGFPDIDLRAVGLFRRNPPTTDESEAYLRASWELQVNATEA